MPYREVYLGDGEYTIARVPDEVVTQWLKDRTDGKVPQDVPNRPPDVDTSYLRAWIVGPRDPGYEPLSNRPSFSESAGDFAVCAFATEIDVADMYAESKLVIAYHADSNEYQFRFIVRTESGRSVVDRTKTIGADQITGEFFDKALAFWIDTFTADYEIIVTTYADMDEAEKELAVAHDELEEWYRVH